MVGFNLLASWGLGLVPTGRTVVLAYTTPLWVTPGAALFLREPLTARRLVGVLVGLAGLVTLFNPLTFDWSDRAVVLGQPGHPGRRAALGREHPAHPRAPLALHPVRADPVGDPARHRCCSPRSRSRPGRRRPRRVDVPSFTLLLLYLGIVGTAVAYWAAATASRHLPAVTTSLGLLATPVVSVITATLWLGEPLTVSARGRDRAGAGRRRHRRHRPLGADGERLDRPAALAPFSPPWPTTTRRPTTPAPSKARAAAGARGRAATRCVALVSSLPPARLEEGRYENGWNGRQILAHIASIEWSYPRLIDIARTPPAPDEQRAAHPHHEGRQRLLQRPPGGQARAHDGGRAARRVRDEPRRDHPGGGGGRRGAVRPPHPLGGGRGRPARPRLPPDRGGPRPRPRARYRRRHDDHHG